MWKLAICHEIFGDIPFEICCKKAREHGFDGLELAPYLLSHDIRDLSIDDRTRLKNTADNYGLKLVALHWLLASPPGLSITSPDPKVGAETKAFFKEIVHLARDLGIDLLVFGSPKQRNIEPGWDQHQAYTRGVSFFKEMSDYSRQYGISIAFEPLGPNVTNFGATFNDANGLIKAVDSPQFKLHVDVKALYDDSVSIVSIIQEGADGILHFHANDTNLLGPGMGNVDFMPILKALKEIGYDGWISVETFKNDVDPDEIASQSIQYLRKIINSI